MHQNGNKVIKESSNDLNANHEGGIPLLLKSDNQGD
jgi:hypothetical protein